MQRRSTTHPAYGDIRDLFARREVATEGDVRIANGYAVDILTHIRSRYGDYCTIMTETDDTEAEYGDLADRLVHEWYDGFMIVVQTSSHSLILTDCRQDGCRILSYDDLNRALTHAHIITGRAGNMDGQPIHIPVGKVEFAYVRMQNRRLRDIVAQDVRARFVTFRDNPGEGSSNDLRRPGA